MNKSDVDTLTNEVLITETKIDQSDGVRIDIKGFEQAVGSILTRFPRVKSITETVYQRANYHLFAERGFEYELHDDVSMTTASQWADIERSGRQFVGFYDICPWNESMDSFVVHEIEDDQVKIVVLGEGFETVLSQTNAWNYQQGSRTQWHPTSEDTLLYNDLEDGRAVGCVHSISDDQQRMIPYPIQAVDPTGSGYLSIDYRRLDLNSPGYGYGEYDGESLSVPSEDGITHVGFDGSTTQIVSLAELRRRASSGVSSDRHYLHHLLYSPDGDYVAFLHRWNNGDRRFTQLYVSGMDGELSLLSENRYLSHFCWLDSRRMFLYGGTDEHGRGYYVVDIDSNEWAYVDALDGYGDGHPSISPDGRLIVTDTYPDRLRNRSLTLYDLESDSVRSLGTFRSPFQFDGTRRCDLHPRWSPDGRFISIDSAHDGSRRTYVIDVSSIVSSE